MLQEKFDSPSEVKKWWMIQQEHQGKFQAFS